MSHFKNRDLFHLLLGVSKTIIWVFMLKENTKRKDHPVPRVILPGNCAGLEMQLVHRPLTWAKSESDIQTVFFGMSGIDIFLKLTVSIQKLQKFCVKNLRSGWFWINREVWLCGVHLPMWRQAAVSEWWWPLWMGITCPSSPQSPTHPIVSHSLPANPCWWPAPSPPARLYHLYELAQGVQILRISYIDRKCTDNLG